MLLALSLLLACGGPSSVALGDFTIDIDKTTGRFSVSHPSGARLDDVAVLSGTGTYDVQFRVGAFKFDNVENTLSRPAEARKLRNDENPLLLELLDADGNDAAEVVFTLGPEGVLFLDVHPANPHDRVGLDAACDADDHFMGTGQHTFDVDHVGEAFAVWVSEPGIGKTEDDAYPEDWFSRGTRHASAYPVPYLIRPHQPSGLLFDTSTRVELDLCATDANRFTVLAWDDESLPIAFIAGATPKSVTSRYTDLIGRPQELPPPWAFAPWNDTVKGEERLMRVAQRIRDFGAPSTVIWTEDWKGGDETNFGYRLKLDWFLDEALYPNAEANADELEDMGFKWFAYFSPFIEPGTATWDDAVANDVVLKDAEGNPLLFTSVRLSDASMVDLSTEAGQAWAQKWMTDALDIGFDGWMADFGEWLPTETVLRNGQTGMDAHNLYPVWWQQANQASMAGRDATFFARSGWTRTPSHSPIMWGGDQRTDWQVDDGFPTVIPLGLGTAVSGHPVFTHDIAGYNSIGNDPTSRELFYRWTALGAFSPVMRTHHGAFDEENHQFDTDDETTAYWAQMAVEHMRTWPYRYGLMRRAVDEGLPMLLPTAFVHGGDDWGRVDAWMLGDALLVAPILEEGVTERQVDLPPGADWYDYWSRSPATSGVHTAELEQIPVFAAAGTTVPLFEVIPDTLTGQSTGLIDFADADAHRRVVLFGGGGPFTEADGTTYTPSGSPSGAAEVTETLTSGTIEAGGVTLTIEGNVERTYTVEVVP